METTAATPAGAPASCEIMRLPEDLQLAMFARAGLVAACRAAAVCQAFHAAVDTDAVWACFLPQDLPPFADMELSPPPASKKELYMRLSNGPVLLADGLTSMCLHRKTGALCYMLSARKLSIALGDSDTPAECRWIPVTAGCSSRFSEAAELRHFRWLEIDGKIDSAMLSQHTTYTAYIVYKVEENGWYGRYSDIFGGSKFPKERDDGWMEVEMGEIRNDEGEDGEVSMGRLRTIPYGKLDLVALGIEIRPKGLLSKSIAHKRSTIWLAFRPPCHLPMLADGEVFEPLMSKKALFLRLLDGPVLLTDGLTNLWLDKETGGLCYMLSARKLSIAWVDNPTIWRRIPITRFRFSKGAELQEVEWLEIRANIDSKMLSQHTTYNAYIVYTLAISFHGLHHPAPKTSVSIGGSLKSTGHVCLVDGYLYSEHWRCMREYLSEDTCFPKDRDGGWMMEAELGEFYTGEGDNGEVSISLMDNSALSMVLLSWELRLDRRNKGSHEKNLVCASK